MDAVQDARRAVDQLLSQARQVTTPCGTGGLAWHVWGSGAPVVLLHGGSGSWTHWVRNIPALVNAGRQVLAVDLPGCGDSAEPPGGGQDADAAVVPVLDGLSVLLQGGSFDLVAFSFGSLVGSLLAARDPGLVDRLVVVGGPVLPLTNPRGAALVAWRNLPDPSARAEAHRANLLSVMLSRQESATADAVALHAINVERDRMRRRRLVTTDAMRRALHRVHCPVSAIYGRQDALYQDRWPELMKAVQELPTLARIVVIEDAGHWVQFEAPDEFNAALADVLHR